MAAPNDLVAKGEYLARAGDCVACHTAPDGKPFAGGFKMAVPHLGVIYTTNITPDKETGIGDYTLDDFIKAMRGPLPDVRLIPTGGVTPETARGYIAAGAWALGVGSELIGKGVMNDGGFESLRRRASDFAEAARGPAK